ncbi:MAG TPA: translocation/assembly module TamB domain-containing protein [Balneolaceae bacterium]|nr:translocation/assembly module TamB domain-containing protein [Balneolaceae bacterium]
MEQDKRRYSRKKMGCLIAVLIVVPLLFFLRLALKSPLVFDMIARYAITQAEGMLDAELQADRIRGDLLSGFTIHELTLRERSGSEIAQIDSVMLEYTLPGLVLSPHTVRKVQIYGADLSLRQESDSTWNLLNILPESEEPAEESTLEWAVEHAELINSSVRVESDYLLPDGLVELRDIETLLEAGSDEEGLWATLHDLQFELSEQRLPGSVAFLLEGEMEGGDYTLERLLIESARSQVRARFQKEGESLGGELHLDPLSRDDLAAYIDSLALEQDIDLSLTARGTLDNLNLTMQVSATGLHEAVVEAGISMAEEAVLTSLSLQITEADLPLLTGIAESPVIGEFAISGAGTLPVQNLQRGEWEGDIFISRLQYDTYSVDRVESDIAYRKEAVTSSWIVQNAGEELRIQLAAQNLFDELIAWNGEIAGNNLNLANWLGEEQPETQTDLLITLNGRGLSAETLEAELHGVLTGGHIAEQPFEQVEISLLAGTAHAEAQLSAILADGEADFNLYSDNWRADIPSYRFDLALRELDLSLISGFEEFPTRINGSAEGSGSGITAEQLTLRASMELDSTLVNGEQIDTFSASIRVEDHFLHLENGTLSSPIADGRFEVRHHISDFTDLRNRGDLALELKDLTSLAPLAGFEEFQISGSADARLFRSDSNELLLEGEFDFSEIRADSLFMADEITGSVEGNFTEIPELGLALQVSNSMVSGQAVQDVRASGTARLMEGETAGTVEIQFSNGSESSLTHQGEYSVTPDLARLQTTLLSFVSQTRELTLESPFEARFQEGVVQMDTLSIRNREDDAFLRMWIPHLDSLSQQAGMEARYLDIGELQRTITGESLADGLLSASISLSNSEEELAVTATGIIEHLMVEETGMDSLRFNADLADEWLEADLHAWNLAEELLAMNLRIPFLPGDPLTFDEQFFEREVEGSLTLAESDVTYWLSFLPDGVPEGTGGLISMEGELNGIAGNPYLAGRLTIREGLLSGMEIDSLGLGVQYEHDSGTAMVNGSVVRESVPVLDFRSALPLDVDLRGGEVMLPSGQDSVLVELEALDFNLAMFGSYMPPDLVQNLEGILSGEISLYGQMSELEAEGQLRIREGRLNAVPAGITLQDLRGDINFESEQITLADFSVDSGPGTLRASGSVRMEGMSLGEMDVRLQANQFRLLNRADLSAIANMEASLTGTPEEPELIGSITFLNTEVNLQNFGEQSVEQVSLEGEEADADTISFYERMRMEMNVNFGRNFYIVSEQYLDMEFVLGGEVDLVKERQEEMQLFGAIEATSGYARPLGKNFELDDAVVTFYGPIENPELNIHTLYEPPQAAGVRIYYIIEGTLEDPEFRFESDPQLELQDIISYTVFGKPFYELESWEQVVAGSGSGPSVSDLAMDVLLDRVELLASQRLGIDVVEIDTNRSGTGSTTSIKTGWYLNQKTFFAILNELGGARPTTLFILEYLLRENLELIITQGDDSREGVDLRWHLDY